VPSRQIGSPVSYANLAILLLDQNRIDEAGALIDKALSLDPAFHVGYIARGRYLLQKGEAAKGLEAILAGSAANPGLSQGLLMAAIAYYQDGDEELADQSLDNADRLIQTIQSSRAFGLPPRSTSTKQTKPSWLPERPCAATASGRGFCGPCHQQGGRLLSSPGLSLPELERVVAFLW
jgi:tetratricopeptide (TPR) repeat protein